MDYQKIKSKDKLQIKTLGELKGSGYQPEGIKDELRRNLLEKIRKGEELFPGIFGYEQTVIPELERAILARHSINLLGLRGQAKTKIARLLTSLNGRGMIKFSKGCMATIFSPSSNPRINIASTNHVFCH